MVHKSTVEVSSGSQMVQGLTMVLAIGNWPSVFQAEVHAITLCARVKLEKGLA